MEVTLQGPGQRADFPLGGQSPQGKRQDKKILLSEYFYHVPSNVFIGDTELALTKQENKC